MKIFLIKFLIISLAGVLIYACQDIENETLTPPPIDLNKDADAGQTPMTKLGKKLKNPYSVANMKKALENLKNKRANARTLGGITEVATTHLYIKFKPQNEEELDILKSDTTLILYDYPLDYEIEEGGSYYHDPTVPADQPTYQYCAVEVDKTLPEGVDYEVLEELFIPDEDKIEDSEEENAVRARKVINGFSYVLVDEALRITGNLEEDENIAIRERRRKWRPAGRIQVWDNVVGGHTTTRQIFDHWEYYNCSTNPAWGAEVAKVVRGGFDIRSNQCRRAVYRTVTESITGSYVPVVGVEVRARRWFTTHKGTTNAQGNYSCDGRFRRPANYSIKWERYHFSVRSGTFGQANLNGPKKTGNWDVYLGNNNNGRVGDKQQYYALIFQAAYDYYYGNRFGLTSPPTNSFFRHQMKISAVKKGGKSSYSHLRNEFFFGIPIFSHIYIKVWNRPSDHVFGVTIHELAHAAHSVVDRGAYDELARKGWAIPWAGGHLDRGARRLIETWPTTVEIMFTLSRYRDHFHQPNYEYGEKLNGFHLRNYQNQRIRNNYFYTSAGWDMIDNINQRTHPDFGDGSNLFPIDRVSGYTIVQLEDALRGARSWNRWKENIRDKYDNPTEDFLDELFDNWN